MIKSYDELEERLEELSANNKLNLSFDDKRGLNGIVILTLDDGSSKRRASTYLAELTPNLNHTDRKIQFKAIINRFIENPSSMNLSSFKHSENKPSKSVMDWLKDVEAYAHKLQMSKQILAISDGTLSVCMRNSERFGQTEFTNSNHIKLVQLSMLHIFTQNPGKYEKWQDVWKDLDNRGLKESESLNIMSKIPYFMYSVNYETGIHKDMIVRDNDHMLNLVFGNEEVQYVEKSWADADETPDTAVAMVSKWDVTTPGFLLDKKTEKDLAPSI